jgi:chromosome segregation ATPase
MNGTNAKPSMSEGATLENLRAQVSEAQRNIEKLNASLASSRQRQGNLRVERESLILPARSQKDDRAQKRIHAIDAELVSIGQDIPDDEAALTKMQAPLDSAQNNLSAAEWELNRAAARQMLVAHLEGKFAANMEKAVRNLEEAFALAAEEDKRIAAALINFDPNLFQEADQLKFIARIRPILAGSKLRDILPIDTREFYPGNLTGRNFKSEDQRWYGQALEALDRLELIF